MENDFTFINENRRDLLKKGIHELGLLFGCSSSHAITADISVAETAAAAEFFLADGVILTGGATGRAANPKELEGEVDKHFFIYFFPQC